MDLEDLNMIKRAKRPGGGYVTVQNNVARDPNLSLRGRGLLLTMLSYPDDWAFDSKRLAEQVQEGRDAVRATMSELEKAGYIVRERIRVDGRFAWDFTIYDTPQEAADVSAGHTMAGFSGHGVTEGGTMAGKPGPENPAMVPPGKTPGQSMAGKPGPENPASNKRPSQRPVTKEDLTPPLASLARPHDDGALPGMPSAEPTKRASRASAPDELFEIFWKTYPRKVGKDAARRAWLKVLNRAEAGLIIEGARRYAADKNREAEFTAHPTTWLNQGRWTDEPLPPRTNGSRLSANQDRLVRGASLVAELRAERDSEYALNGHTRREISDGSR